MALSFLNEPWQEVVTLDFESKTIKRWTPIVLDNADHPDVAAWMNHVEQVEVPAYIAKVQAEAEDEDIELTPEERETALRHLRERLKEIKHR